MVAAAGAAGPGSWVAQVSGAADWATGTMAAPASGAVGLATGRTARRASGAAGAKGTGERASGAVQQGTGRGHRAAVGQAGRVRGTRRPGSDVATAASAFGLGKTKQDRLGEEASQGLTRAMPTQGVEDDSCAPHPCYQTSELPGSGSLTCVEGLFLQQSSQDPPLQRTQLPKATQLFSQFCVGQCQVHPEVRGQGVRKKRDVALQPWL